MAVTPAFIGCANKGAGTGAVDNENAGVDRPRAQRLGRRARLGDLFDHRPGRVLHLGHRQPHAGDRALVRGRRHPGRQRLHHRRDRAVGRRLDHLRRLGDLLDHRASTTTIGQPSRSTATRRRAPAASPSTARSTSARQSTRSRCRPARSRSAAASRSPAPRTMPDNGPAALTYQWTRQLGDVQRRGRRRARPSPARRAGTSTVTLTVSDGDTTAGCPATLSAAGRLHDDRERRRHERALHPRQRDRADASSPATTRAPRSASTPTTTARCDFGRDAGRHRRQPGTSRSRVDRPDGAHRRHRHRRRQHRERRGQPVAQRLPRSAPTRSTEQGAERRHQRAVDARSSAPMEANGTTYATEKAEPGRAPQLAAVAVPAAAVIADAERPLGRGPGRGAARRRTCSPAASATRSPSSIAATSTPTRWPSRAAIRS